MYTHAIRVRKGCVISILRPTFDQEKKTKFCKQQKIGGFEYFGDSDVVNKLLKESKDSKFDDNFNIWRQFQHFEYDVTHTLSFPKPNKL